MPSHNSGNCLNDKLLLGLSGAATEEIAAAAAPATAQQEAEPPPQPVVVPGRHRRLTTVACVTVIVLGVTAFSYYARAVVLPVVIAWVLATALNPPMRRLRAWRLPAPVAALVVMVGLLVPVMLGVGRFSAPVAEWFEHAPENVARLKERLRLVLRPAQRLSEAAASVGNVTRPESGRAPAAKVEVADHRLTTTVFSWTAGALVSIGETLALTFLLLASGDTFIQKLVKVMSTFHDKRRAVDLAREVQHSVSTYLFTVCVVNLILGTVLAALLALVGMPQPVMWGVLAALLNCIPYFGAVLGVALVGIAGLSAFETPGQGLLPAALYLGLHLVEANIVTPMVVGRRFTLNPVVVFTALIFFVWLWGAAGALVAMPVLVSAKIISERVPALAAAGEFLSS